MSLWRRLWEKSWSAAQAAAQAVLLPAGLFVLYFLGLGFTWALAVVAAAICKMIRPMAAMASMFTPALVVATLMLAQTRLVWLRTSGSERITQASAGVMPL